jgi:hypothetical protein
MKWSSRQAKPVVQQRPSHRGGGVGIKSVAKEGEDCEISKNLLAKIGLEDQPAGINPLFKFQELKTAGEPLGEQLPS